MISAALRAVVSAVALLASFGEALAQSTPNLITGQVPTAAQWNSFFSAKQDALGYAPVNRAGDTMLGKLTTLTPTTSAASINLPPGSPPSTPTNGDFWTTSAGLYGYINGSTVGPFATSVSAGAGGTSGQIQYNSAGSIAGFTMGGDCTFSQPNITCTKSSGTSFGALAFLGVGAGLLSTGGNLALQSPVTAANGGTGVNNGASTVTLASNLTVSGTGGLTTTIGGATNSTFPAGTHTLAALDLADQTVSGGANVTPYSIGLLTNSSTTTIDCGKGPLQWAVNQASSSLTIQSPAFSSPYTPGGSCVVQFINAEAGTAATPTLSGFIEGVNTGATYAGAPARSATCTISNASPGVVTYTAHGMTTYQPVFFTTTGALPSPLIQGTVYYSSPQSSNTYDVSLTPGGANINTTTSGSGTHTCYVASVFELQVLMNNGIATYSWIAHQ